MPPEALRPEQRRNRAGGPAGQHVRASIRGRLHERHSRRDIEQSDDVLDCCDRQLREIRGDDQHALAGRRFHAADRPLDCPVQPGRRVLGDDGRAVPPRDLRGLPVRRRHQHAAEQVTARGQCGEDVFEHQPGQVCPLARVENRREAQLGCVERLHRNNRPDGPSSHGPTATGLSQPPSATLRPAPLSVVSPDSVPANATTSPASRSRSARSVINVRVTSTGTSMPAASCRVGLVQHQPVDQPAIVRRDGGGVRVDAELRHDLDGRPLDRLAADDRRHGDHRRGGVASASRTPGSGEDRIDAQIRVRRADDDRAGLPGPTAPPGSRAPAPHRPAPSNRSDRTTGAQRRSTKYR